jgi:hypothetical protein
MSEGGASLHQLREDMTADIQPDTAAAHPLRKLTQEIVLAAPQDPSLGHRVADDYLRAMALVLLQWAWRRIEVQLNKDMPQVEERWLAPAKAFHQWVLPEFAMRCHIIQTQCQTA